MATKQAEHPLLSSAHKRDIHIVMLNRGSGAALYPLDSADDATGIFDAVDHLVSLGHVRLLHLAGPTNFTTRLVRSEAFSAASRKNPGDSGTVIQSPALSTAEGQSLMDGILEFPTSVRPPCSPETTFSRSGCSRRWACTGSPVQTICLSVAGFSDMFFAEDIRPAFTRVHVPYLQMGMESGRLLLEEIAGGQHSSLTATLAASLVVRDSTSSPRPN